MGNPLGNLSLAADWIGSALAGLLGVPTPEPTIGIVSAGAISTAPHEVQQWAMPGPALATRFLLESTNIVGASQLTQCENVSDISRLMVLDTWIEVLDRQRPDGAWNLLIDTSGAPRLVVIDYGFSLSDTIRPRGVLLPSEPRLICPGELWPYIQWPEARATVDDMLDISRAQLTEIVDSVPREWGVEEEAKSATIEYLFYKRETVDRLVGQEET